LAECRTCGVWWWYRKTGGRFRRYCPKCVNVPCVQPSEAAPVPCSKCGTPFLALGALMSTGGLRYQRRRCDVCAAVHHNKERQCQRCGRAFLVLGASDPSRYCSRDCVVEARQAARHPKVPCKVCGSMYRMKRIRRKPQLTCGKQRCASAYKVRYATAEERREARRQQGDIQSGIRRARAKAAGWERISRQAIIERDGLRCGVCRKPIDPTNKTWHKRLSLDHIVPISQGGGHTFSNLRLAHLGCNVRRGRVKHAQPVLL